MADSPELEAALLAIANAYGIDQNDPDDSGQDEAIEALRALWDAAKREALLEAARAGCAWCAKGWSVAKNPTRKYQRHGGPVCAMYSHEVPVEERSMIGPDCQCDASPIWDSLTGGGR